tara:strand:- start:1162 stop:1392 length:231 start_codon:yes stop_codon:yes gene_type:complete
MVDDRKAILFNLNVLLNTEGKIEINFEGPPSPEQIEEAFDSWDEGFEHTKKIVSLVEYLRDYSELVYKDINKIISV